MTSFHMAGNNVVHSPENLRTKGWYYMKKCIFELANGLSNNVKDLPLDVARDMFESCSVSNGIHIHLVVFI